MRTYLDPGHLPRQAGPLGLRVHLRLALRLVHRFSRRWFLILMRSRRLFRNQSALRWLAGIALMRSTRHFGFARESKEVI